MRLTKNSEPSLLPFPIRRDTTRKSPSAEQLSRHLGGTESSAVARTTGDLVDLVADHRPDLLKTLLQVLHDSETTCEHVEKLIELVTACGVSDEVSPCATATAISADLEKLASTSDRWTHPAQVVRQPHLQALHKLCAARSEQETGTARERLANILPRLERAARLMKKAASRRDQEAARHQK